MASAQFAGGTGDPNDPYLIADPNHLFSLADDPNHYDKHFKLTADLDLDPNLTGIPHFITALIAPDQSGPNTESSSGNSHQGPSFVGTFDGGGYNISNLTIDTAGAGYKFLGLFGLISGTSAEVKNLQLENVNVAGGDRSLYIGSLFGANGDYWRPGGTISNCYATGSVGAGDNSEFIGGLCGANTGTTRNCYTSTSVSGAYLSARLGGLCGVNGDPKFPGISGIISNCYATGSVNAGNQSTFLGGLSGTNAGALDNCYASGIVTGGHETDYLGGLAGENTGTIGNCYAIGSVSGGDAANGLGGLCGLNSSSIINSYALGNVDILGGGVMGGFCGSNSGGTFSSCFWDTQSSGTTDGLGDPGPDPNGVTGKITALMQTKSTFTDAPANWDFIDASSYGAWRMCIDGIDYPRLAWQSNPGDLLCPDGVTLPDFAFFADQSFRSNCAAPDYCDGADLDYSGAVTADDLTIFHYNWLTGVIP